jgi:hypothetical protein
MRHVAPLLLAPAVLLDGSPAFAQRDRLQTIVNGTPLTDSQKVEFIRIYGGPPLAGDFWYDTKTVLATKHTKPFGHEEHKSFFVIFVPRIVSTFFVANSSLSPLWL